MKKVISYLGVILVVVVITVLSLKYWGSSQKTNTGDTNVYVSNPSASSYETTSVQNRDTKVNTAVEYGFLDLTMFSENWQDGTFRCGSDFEPGEYYVFSLTMPHAIYATSDSPNDHPLTDSNRLLKKLSIKSGEYIHVSIGTVMVPANEVDENSWDTYGVFLVGEDLRAGEYRIEPVTDTYIAEQMCMGAGCYYQISEGKPENVPKYFESVQTQSYLLLEDGQYLSLVNARLILIEEAETEPSASATIDTKTEVPNNTESSSKTDEDKYKNFDKSSAYLAAKSILEDTLQTQNPRVEYNESTRTVYVSIVAPEGTTYYLLTNKSSLVDSWNTMSDNLCDLSESVSSMIHEAGYDVDCTFYFLSDYNQDNSLLTVSDGIIIYNVMDE